MRILVLLVQFILIGQIFGALLRSDYDEEENQVYNNYQQVLRQTK